MVFSDIGIVCFSGLELFKNPKFGSEFDKIPRLEKVKIPIRIIEITRALDLKALIFMHRPPARALRRVFLAPFTGLFLIRGLFSLNKIHLENVVEV